MLLLLAMPFNILLDNAVLHVEMVSDVKEGFAENDSFSQSKSNRTAALEDVAGT
jgi:hypothetical protein